jgi:hypothetical protein
MSESTKQGPEVTDHMQSVQGGSVVVVAGTEVITSSIHSRT